MSTIITKNSSTASAVPSAGDLVKGELAVNVTDKKLYTKDNSATVVKVVGSLGNQEANAVAITGGTVAGVAQTGGTINNTPVGATTASTVRGTTVTATTGFVGDLTGSVTGNTTGVHTGAVTGNVTGNLTGNVTAATGTSTFSHVTISGSLDMDAGTSATITGLATPVNNTDAATKIYVDTAISNLVDGAPANLDTLNEIAAALNDDANLAATLTASIATKVSKAGDSMTGALAMGTNKITGLGTPTAGTDATTKTYVDTADALKLNLAGGTMSGALAMGSNKITGLGTPTADADATTKVYVDGILGSATSAAASASAAATSATNAANSASAASTSASNASASASSAAASFDSFDDRYLGPKASAPTLDNDGNALLTGALYWNSTSSNLWVWNGSAWTQATLTAGSFATLAGTETLTNKTLTSPVINTPTGIVKGDVGLANVDNTSDATKNSAIATLTNKTISFGSNTLTDVASINTAQTFTGTKTFSGTSSALAMVLNDAAEVATVSATAATGTINYDITTQSVLYYTSNASANWTVNFRASSGTSLNTALATGQSVTVAFLVTQGATAFFNNVVQVDGTTSGVTTRWLGGAPTAGNASGIDSYRYLLVKTGSATYTVLASVTQFKA